MSLDQSSAAFSSYLNLIGANSGTGGGGQMTGLIFPMVDERNKRGRPPKKPKPAEQEQKEKNLLNQKIMEQIQQQQHALGLTITPMIQTLQMEQDKPEDVQKSGEDNSNAQF